ncbi:glycosyltransferase [Rhodococcus fascians]|nr:glycosyltransferase [Rhodococcus fascians]
MATKSPKILIVGLNYSPEVTGIAPYTAGMATGLHQLGFDTTVLTGYPHYPAWRIHPDFAGRTMTHRIDDVPVCRVRQYTPRTPKLLNRLLMEVSFGLKVITKRWGSPDIVILVSPALVSTALVAMRVKLGRSRPALGIWVQDIYSKGLTETGSAPTYLAEIARRLESKTFRSAQEVAVIHDRFKTELVSSLGVDPQSLSVIRNWVHIKHKPKIDRAKTREAMNWPPGAIIALHAGNMGAKQGLENIVDAARLCESQGLPIIYVLVGDGNQRLKLLKQASGLTNIRFTDTLSDIDYWAALCAADILIVNEKPGVTDMAVPSKLTSYFAAGRPVIAATEASSTTAFELRASGAGLRVDPGQPADLNRQVVQLDADKELSNKLASAADDFINQTLGREHAISSFATWIQKLNSSKIKEQD